MLKLLGGAIRRARSECQMSQEALADLAEIDRSHMGRIERGERNITILNLRKISSALDVSMAELLSAARL
ncbi:helix-turn-helix transcriptional regulator [Parerythrobacter aurantius]|uniref:helix-turn-helix domain-containing protein n=1 Tax=Parerythrobacter aurantius TaxID=3127706 RepID=UPI003247984F